MFRTKLKPGDVVIYRKQKYTTRPGRRARQVQPAPNGDYYTYIVEKFWIVGQSMADGRLLLQTRRGKTHVVDDSDPSLRRPSLLDHIRYRTRFSQLERTPSASGS